MKAALRRWWRHRQGVPFEFITAREGLEPGTLWLTLQIPSDYETWSTVLECRRLKP